MFTPTKEDVRRFFRDTWDKHRSRQILTPLETMALDWIVEHPEYHALLESGAVEIAEFHIEDGQESAPPSSGWRSGAATLTAPRTMSCSAWEKWSGRRSAAAVHCRPTR